jgi:hypothetical protein
MTLAGSLWHVSGWTSKSWGPVGSWWSECHPALWMRTWRTSLTLSCRSCTMHCGVQGSRWRWWGLGKRLRRCSSGWLLRIAASVLYVFEHSFVYIGKLSNVLDCFLCHSGGHHGFVEACVAFGLLHRTTQKLHEVCYCGVFQCMCYCLGLKCGRTNALGLWRVWLAPF